MRASSEPRPMSGALRPRVSRPRAGRGVSSGPARVPETDLCERLTDHRPNFSAFNLDKFSYDSLIPAVQLGGNRLSLQFNSEAANPLSIGRDAKAGNEIAGSRGHAIQEHKGMNEQIQAANGTMLFNPSAPEFIADPYPYLQ
jgi:hypothetical protein